MEPNVPPRPQTSPLPLTFSPPPSSLTSKNQLTLVTVPPLLRLPFSFACSPFLFLLAWRLFLFSFSTVSLFCPFFLVFSGHLLLHHVSLFQFHRENPTPFNPKFSVNSRPSPLNSHISPSLSIIFSSLLLDLPSPSPVTLFSPPLFPPLSIPLFSITISSLPPPFDSRLPIPKTGPWLRGALNAETAPARSRLSNRLLPIFPPSSMQSFSMWPIRPHEKQKYSNFSY